nr:hypothetical protein [Tanacetum cinerariifolium]
MVAILEKSDAAGGFEQIIDFLSGSYIHHALTVNPHVYISCIKQFWNTVVVKRSGDVTRLQALVDKKRIVISEEVVREILQLNDAEGVVSLPNEEIFAGLARMGYEKPSTKLTFYKAFFSTQWKFFINTILHSLSAKRTSWNEFSSAMASALICLSSGQRFNFSKYIFESLVRNVDSSSKFYMYPRVGKGFSGVETPLFETMLAVQMDNPNITMEEYSRLEEEKAHRCAIVLNDALTYKVMLSCKPTLSPLNDNQIDFRISFDESDDKDYTTVFNQMEATIDQCSADKNNFEIQIKQLMIDNDQLLNQIMSREIMHIAMNSVEILDVNKSCVDDCSVENVKKDIDEIETINIEMEHSVAKLLSENENLKKEREHLKYIFKDQFDSIKQIRVRSKEHSDSLIAQINAKSVENLDLNAQLQEKVFAITTLKNELRKLKGKDVIYSAVSKTTASTISPGMFKINLEPLAPMLLKNKDAHIDYINHSKKNTDILQELVEIARALSPLDSNLDSACKYVQRIQEVLFYVKETCPCLSKPSEKFVAVTPMDKDKRVRFAEALTYSSITQKPQDSNKHLLNSTRVNCSTSASGSKPLGNTKNNRISQSSSSNMTNKVEDQSRSIWSRVNKESC